MIRMARFRLRPEALEAGEEAIETFIDAVADSEAGTLRYESFRSPDGREHVHLMEFADAAAAAAHRESAHVKAFVDTLYPLCVEPPVFTDWERVAAVGAARVAVRTVRHEERFPASPEEVYDALMDAARHAAFTGMAASIARGVGGRFLTCDGKNHGMHLELVPGKRIVQAWAHQDWPAGAWSVATFELLPDEAGTRLVFTQVGVPNEAFGWIDAGWRATYWEPLARYLARERRAPAATSAPAGRGRSPRATIGMPIAAAGDEATSETTPAPQRKTPPVGRTPRASTPPPGKRAPARKPSKRR